MRLRLATDNDKSLILAWRNNPLNYAGYYTQKSSTPWEEHDAWWKSRNQDWRIFIAEIDSDEPHPVGWVCIGQLDHWSPEIGYTVGNPADWRKGYGTEMVRLAMDWLREYGKKHCHTTITDSNIGSIKIVKKLGFKRLGTAREGESWYQINL